MKTTVKTLLSALRCCIPGTAVCACALGVLFFTLAAAITSGTNANSFCGGTAFTDSPGQLEQSSNEEDRKWADNSRISAENLCKRLSTRRQNRLDSSNYAETLPQPYYQLPSAVVPEKYFIRTTTCTTLQLHICLFVRDGPENDC